MRAPNTGPALAAVSFIEAHLQERLDLETVARAAGYSKYHLHRAFTEAAGMTPHDYIRRRRLTEAARRLVFSGAPAVEIALAAGYESQQAFTAVFKAMYKRTPLEFRRDRTFYPLQLELALDPCPSGPLGPGKVSCASPDDIPGWMDFTALVIGGFPRLDRASHLEQLRGHIRRREALIARDGAVITGAAAFSRRTGNIDFLAVHPRYRRGETARALLDAIVRVLPGDREIGITTFRRGDPADTGQREAYRRLGFAESELLTEFGYPAQRLVLPAGRARP